MSDEQQQFRTAMLLGWGVLEVVLAVTTTVIGAAVLAFLF
jgi:hypothetical protein